MFKLNITSLILLVALVWALIFSINKYSSAKHYKEAFEEKIEKSALWESDILQKHEEAKVVLQDSIKYYKDLAEVNLQKANYYKRNIIQLRDDFSQIRPEVEEISYDSSYTFLSSSYEPLNSPKYSFTGNQVEELHIDYLEGIKCKEIKENLELENKYLNLSLVASGEMLVKMEEEYAACDIAIREMGEKLMKSQVENKGLKKKVRNYKIVAGVTTAIAVLLAL